jgi:hypothetical protein
MRYANKTEPRMAKPQPTLPQEPGYYWAKWFIPEDGTEGLGVGEEHFVRTNCWEVVSVVNAYGEGDEDFRVEVPGVERTQSVENFKWAQPCVPLSEPN